MSNDKRPHTKGPRRSRPVTPSRLVAFEVLMAVDVDDADLQAILSVDVDGWKSAIPEIREHLSRFEPQIPAALPAAVDRLESALA